MKKIYSSLILLSFLSFSIAQTTLNYPKDIELDDYCITQKTNSPSIANNLKSKAVIWSEDFSGGFPAGWTIQDASGICPWVWSNDGSWGYYNSNNNGASAGTSINSSSTANGFLICDPDSANNATYGQPSGSTYQYLDTYFTTSAIDLTGYPSVVLQFEQYFRYNNNVDMNVMVSNNNISWTTYTVQGNSLNNTYSGNPDTVKINISAVAGNQATVYIKIGWDARVYFWQIDDIKISEAETNDLSITNHYFGSLNLPYYQIPDEQVTAIDFSANVLNNGAVDQPNTTLTIDVNNGTFSGTSSSVNLAVGNSDSLACSTQYTPSSSLGTRTLTWTVASDSIDDIISDNTTSESIEITDYIYARDKDVITGSWGNSGEAYEIGNYFDINANQDLTYIDFIPSSNSNIGAVVYGVVYSINQGNFVWEGNTDDYILTSNDVNNNNTISLPLFSPLPLTAGVGYLVCAGSYGDGGVTNDFRVATSGTSDPQTSYKYDGTDLTWYYLTSTPMVRMNFDPSGGINDNTDLNIQLGQNNPNPFNDHTYIKFELMDNTSARIEISDITGKIIEVISLDNISKGIHEIEINSKNYNSGSYLYSLISGEHRITKQMIIY